MTSRTGKLLIIDDDEDVLFAAKLCLRSLFSVVQIESDPEILPELLAQECFDVILLDMNFKRDVSSGQEGLTWLERILETDSTTSVVMITAYGDVELAVKTIKHGATDFIVKPWKNQRLLATVSSALALAQSRHSVTMLHSRQKQLSDDLDSPYRQFIGDSEAMGHVFTMIEKVASTEANVLISGEHGTGKELAARALHRASMRAEEPFIKVDLGALSGSLFESELFGHVKGAFTDAKEDRAGRFVSAEGGTLFLDEIGNLDLGLQAKLLTAIQSRQVTQVGANTERPVDIRLICASNMSLPTMVADGLFRQDLLYRINTVEIRLPPLRERHEDIASLTQYFLGIYSRKYHREISRISPPARQKLKRYAWPGNVRELQHAVERAVIMSNTRVLQAEDFFLQEGEKNETDMADVFNLEEVERVVIRKAMARFDGNISQVARELGLSRSALYRRLKLYDL
jgi:DNA-binding NtrC family response regulator